MSPSNLPNLKYEFTNIKIMFCNMMASNNWKLAYRSFMSSQIGSQCLCTIFHIINPYRPVIWTGCKSTTIVVHLSIMLIFYKTRIPCKNIQKKLEMIWYSRSCLHDQYRPWIWLKPKRGNNVITLQINSKNIQKLMKIPFLSRTFR